MDNKFCELVVEEERLFTSNGSGTLAPSASALDAAGFRIVSSID